MMRKFFVAIFFLAPLGLASVTAAAQGNGETVKIQDYPGVGNMLFRVAMSKGYCEQHGIKCELQMIPNAPLGTQALLAKNIDVALIPGSVQMNAMLKGARIKGVAGGFVFNPLTVVVSNQLSAPNAGKGYPAMMQDLVGKRIGVPVRGGDAEFQFILMLQKAGFKADDVSFVAVGAPNTSYPALISGQVDAVISIEPQGTMCELLKTCREIWRGSESPEPKELAAINGGGALFVLRQDDIDQKRSMVEAFVDAAKEAETFIQNPANFDEIVKIANTYFKFDLPNGEAVMVATLRRAIPGYRTSISRPAVKAYADFMYATKQIDVPFDYTTLIDDKAP